MVNHKMASYLVACSSTEGTIGLQTACACCWELELCRCVACKRKSRTSNRLEVGLGGGPADVRWACAGEMKSGRQYTQRRDHTDQAEDRQPSPSASVDEEDARHGPHRVHGGHPSREQQRCFVGCVSCQLYDRRTVVHHCVDAYQLLEHLQVDWATTSWVTPKRG